jgi:hypothetical protein
MVHWELTSRGALAELWPERAYDTVVILLIVREQLKQGFMSDFCMF